MEFAFADIGRGGGVVLPDADAPQEGVPSNGGRHGGSDGRMTMRPMDELLSSLALDQGSRCLLLLTHFARIGIIDKAGQRRSRRSGIRIQRTFSGVQAEVGDF